MRSWRLSPNPGKIWAASNPLCDLPCIRVRRTCGTETAAHVGASELNAGQPGKIEAALLVDWFYALSPFDLNYGHSFSGKEHENGVAPSPTRKMILMGSMCQEIVVGFERSACSQIAGTARPYFPAF